MTHHRVIWGKMLCIHPIPDGTTGGELISKGLHYMMAVKPDPNGDCLILPHWIGEPPERDYDAVVRYQPSLMTEFVRVLRPADAR